jgi:hypothetical protein
MSDGALRAVKKLYIRLCAARDSRGPTTGRGALSALVEGQTPRSTRL